MIPCMTHGCTKRSNSAIIQLLPDASFQTVFYYALWYVLFVTATSTDQVIQLTFVDVFRIEYHPDCAYDYLEVRIWNLVYLTVFDRKGTTLEGTTWVVLYRVSNHQQQQAGKSRWNPLYAKYTGPVTVAKLGRRLCLAMNVFRLTQWHYH